MGTSYWIFCNISSQPNSLVLIGIGFEKKKKKSVLSLSKFGKVADEFSSASEFTESGLGPVFDMIKYVVNLTGGMK